MLSWKKIEIIIGHYGSGKTNFAVNLALLRANAGERVTIVDLDIVNPYFRTADFGALFDKRDISLVKPRYANTNLDIPALSFDLDSLITGDGCVIVDVGGDDVGAVVLGRSEEALSGRDDVRVSCVLNQCRLLTERPHEAAELLREMEASSHLRVGALINNTNLGNATTTELVERSAVYAKEVSALTGIPVLCTAVRRDLAPSLRLDGEVMPVDIHVRPIWEEE